MLGVFLLVDLLKYLIGRSQAEVNGGVLGFMSLPVTSTDNEAANKLGNCHDNEALD